MEPFDKDYKEAEKYVIVNEDDPDLMPVRIPMPPCPDITTIDGYGLPAKEQKFQRPTIPERLLDLELEIEDMTEIKDFLSKNQREWKEEIEFIEREWQRRLNGYWFYNNGTPTFISGTHYLYISYWEIDIGIPEYRSRDRKFFLFARFCELDDDSVGFVYPKHRREGATNKTQVWIYDATSRSRRKHSGIQSATEGHAADVFTKHLVPGWKSLPFFFKPIFQGTTDPKKVLNFSEPAEKVVKGRVKTSKTKALGSWIDFKSSDIKAYDSRKLLRYQSDECGKFTDGDILLRHSVVKQCLMTGNKIVGKSAYTSTVGEMDKGGGARFKQLCDQSHYDHWIPELKRNKNGRTITGLYNLFIPAHDCLEGFIDEYGNGMIEEAKIHIHNNRKALMDIKDYDSLSEYIRMYPTQYRECFRGDSSKCQFNIKIIEDRLDELTFTETKPTVKGRFAWKDNIKDTEVIWVPDPRGPFEVTYLPKEGEKNRYFTREGTKVPANETKFIAGADPYKFNKTTSGKKSDGAGAVFMKHDSSIDNQDKEIADWVSNRFVCTYKHRPLTKNEYGEDMLMMCIYYGCKLNPETNVPFLWEYFEERKYKGYLWYGRDRRTHKYNKKPGTHTSDAVRDEIFREIRTYIENHGPRENSEDFLRDCLEIEDKMNDFDLFVACGLALLANKTEVIPEAEEEVDGDAFWHDYGFNQ